MSDMREQLNKVKFYIANLKALMGIGIVVYAIYVASTDIPAKMSQLEAKKNENVQLTQKKSSLSTEEQKLKGISKELDKITTKIVTVETGNSPELAVIQVAQKIVELSEQTKNTYVALEPSVTTILDIDKVVTLPITLPADVPITPGGDDAPPGAPVAATPPPPSGGAATSNIQSPLNAFKYILSIQGSYANLATFINTLAKYEHLVIITKVNLTTNEFSTKGSPEDILLKMEFLIPWISS